MAIGFISAKYTSARRRRVGTLASLVLASILFVGASCAGERFEFVNETGGPITLTAIPPPPSERTPVAWIIEPDETFETLIFERSPDARWVITDADGVLLMEVVVGYEFVDYFESQIVVR